MAAIFPDLQLSRQYLIEAYLILPISLRLKFQAVGQVVEESIFAQYDPG